MDAQQLAALAQVAGSLTFNTFLLVVWWLERAERLKDKAETARHLQADIDWLLEQTEQKTAVK